METMIISSLNNEDPVFDPSFVTLKHNSGLSLDWTREEQSILEEGLAKYSSETKLVQYYSKIAYDLDNKTIRDVALRVKFMNKRENSKRRKGDHKLTWKSNDEKEKVLDSSHFVAQPNVTPATIMTDNGDGISCQSIADPIAELLEQTEKALNQISENIDTLQLQANIPLFCQTRDNIMTIWNDLKDKPEMKGIPPFHFNMDVANSILPETTFPKQ